MTEQLKICPYCKNEIRPLDDHAISLIPSKVEPKSVEVKCILKRYYLVEIIEQK